MNLEPYLSIQLNKIVKKQFSEDEIKHIIEYLDKQKIEVRGISEDLEDNFENYDYHYTLKNTQTPEKISSEQTLKDFQELRDCKDEKRKQELIEEITNGNAKLAEWVLHKYYLAYGLNKQEWKAIAYEGLFKAIKAFDIEYGTKFTTYAVKVIRNHLKKEIADYYNFPVNNFSDFWYAMRIVEQSFEKKYKPGDKEMLEDILNLLEYQGTISSKMKNKYLKKQVYYIEDNQKELENEEIFDVEENYERKERPEKIIEILDTLTPRERDVLLMRYGFVGEPKSLQQIGKEFNLSQERIRQIEMKALRKLRHPSRSRRVRDYFNGRIPNSRYVEPTTTGEFIDLEEVFRKYKTNKKQEEQIEELKDVINEVEEEVENLFGKTKIRIVKLKLGIGVPRALTYEEISEIVNQPEDVVRYIGEKGIKELKEKIEFKNKFQKFLQTKEKETGEMAESMKEAIEEFENQDEIQEQPSFELPEESTFEIQSVQEIETPEEYDELEEYEEPNFFENREINYEKIGEKLGMNETEIKEILKAAKSILELINKDEKHQKNK